MPGTPRTALLPAAAPAAASQTTYFGFYLTLGGGLSKDLTLQPTPGQFRVMENILKKKERERERERKSNDTYLFCSKRFREKTPSNTHIKQATTTTKPRARTFTHTHTHTHTHNAHTNIHARARARARAHTQTRALKVYHKEILTGNKTMEIVYSLHGFSFCGYN